ncbi:MAG TPA: peptide-methionine (S)-S-oxide reductase MsrA [Nitrospiria bacterium]|nr:peptide-methionine (S)-S-oxide reductase MsrA [Nitrospiria bacterium]
MTPPPVSPEITPVNTEKAVFAGGCFWCMEPPFEKLKGVISATSGYTGGHQENPNYQTVTSGHSGHAEAVEIEFDPSIISYGELLKVFWVNIDPTRADGQFCDTGTQYRTGIFYLNEEQKRLAEASKTEITKTKKFKEAILTEIVPASIFYKAENFHQDYYMKNPVRYKFYRYNCGRDDRLKELWG